MKLRPPITEHQVYVLAARLRVYGVYVAARDVFRWPRFTIGMARIWLETVAPYAGPDSWADFMGELLPTPSQRSWPDRSAHGRDLGGAGRVDRAE